MKLDISTLIGLLMITMGLGYGFMHSAKHDWGIFISMYINQPESFMIVIVGSLGSVVIGTPIGKLIKMVQVTMRGVMSDGKISAYKELINEMTEYAMEARRNGVLALDAKTEQIQDPFIKNGIQLAVDGTAPEQIESIMQQEVECMKKRHEHNQEVILKWAEYAPAYGLLGTLMGLIAMLASMSDPSSIGPAMALAMTATLYGVIIANCFGIPLVAKLSARTKEEVARKEMIIDAILAIQNGDNPRVVKQKLLTYIPAPEREGMADKDGEK